MKTQRPPTRRSKPSPRQRAAAQLAELRETVRRRGIRTTARQLSVTPTAVLRAINGTTWPRLDILADLADATGVTITLD